jgi:hypothetical protein
MALFTAIEANRNKKKGGMQIRRETKWGIAVIVN